MRIGAGASLSRSKNPMDSAISDAVENQLGYSGMRLFLPWLWELEASGRMLK
jgi:Na+-transporting NADH:ubiquinone oxidoreductase subunit NqrD